MQQRREREWELSIGPDQAAFLDTLDVTIVAAPGLGNVRVTLDGSAPTAASPKYAGPLHLTMSTTITAAVCAGEAVSMRTASRFYERITWQDAVKTAAARPGLSVACFLTRGDTIEKVAHMAGYRPDLTLTVTGLDVEVAPRETNYGLIFSGFLEVPADGLYRFTLNSDDGSQLLLGDRVIVDNDGFHNGETPKFGSAALRAGKHPVRVLYFQGREARNLDLGWEGPGVTKGAVPNSAYSRP